MQDYSQQLSEIVKALNRPTSSAWIIALFSATLGMLTGLLAQPIQFLLIDAYRRHVMRRIAYVELGNMFIRVEMDLRAVFLNPSEQKESILAELRFDGERYCQDHVDIYLQLREHKELAYQYRMFHNITDDKTDSLDAARWAMLQFVRFVNANDQHRKRYRRYFGAEAPSLFARIQSRSVESQEYNDTVKKQFLERVEEFKQKSKLPEP